MHTIEMQPMPMMRNKVASPNSNIWKQVLMSVMTGLLCLCGGITYGHSAVLVPKLKADVEFPYNDEYDSWIAATAPLSMAFGCLFSGVMIDNLGRKYSSILLMWPFLIGYLVLAFAKTMSYIFLARFLTGMCGGLFRSIGAVYLVEVTDPKNRAAFQFTLSLASTTGVLVSHVVGEYLSLKYSSVVFCSPILIGFVIIVFMKESPLWLISKGKIDDGIESFEWYRCIDEAAQRELTDILEEQKNKIESKQFTKVMNIIFSKKFFKAYCTGFFLFVTMQFCGLNNLIFYAQDLFRPTFGGKINAYLLMVMVDSLRMLANILVIPVIRFCPRRKSFFVIASMVIMLLIAIIVFMIVEPAGFIWILLVSFILFTLVGGVMISAAWSFVAEIFPNEIRGIGLGMSGATSFFLLFVSVIFTPEIMESYGVVAVYSFFAICVSISLVILLFLLPDTDGKSLHEIEKSL